MRIIEKQGKLIIEDQAFRLWFFYGSFVVLGMLVAACPLGLCADTRAVFELKDYAFIGMGLFACAAGLSMIKKTSITRTEIDREKGTLHISKRGLFIKENDSLQLSDIQEPVIVETEGSEGAGYQLKIKLKDGRLLALSSYESGAKKPMDEALEAVRRVLSQILSRQ